MKFAFALLLASLSGFPGQASIAATAAPIASKTTSVAPDLDLSIQYYSRVLTPEGVTRESRYEEKMLRRPGHVWVTRVIPASVAMTHDDQPATVNWNKKVALNLPQHDHKHFNPVLIPRHVVMENKQLRVEYVDTQDKQIVAIPATDYENVNFDGSWENSFYLLDPKLVSGMPLSAQASTIQGARWREREKNGVFQRVLWDEQKMVPLVIESGDKAGTFYRRVDVKLSASLTRDLPWNKLKDFGQKEYSDFLD